MSTKMLFKNRIVYTIITFTRVPYELICYKSRNLAIVTNITESVKTSETHSA